MASGSNSKPSIFLSHSGAQKPFTEQLYYELYHLNHRPFFDQDPVHSLPKCEEFPKLIEEACRVCKMGVVVLSHQYIESFWPMWELEQLVFHNPTAHIYPLFFKLSPGDLTHEKNLRRWQDKWDEISASHNHDTSKWPQALEKLKILGGEVFQPKTSQHAYIQRIVTNICQKLPPPLPNFLVGDIFIKGKERMAKIIADRFKEEEEECSDRQGASLFMGVHGVGGSGKSTLCKNMVDFYNASDEYAGKSWCLELPSDGNEKMVVEELTKLLRHFSQGRAQNIDNVNQAVDLLKEHMCKNKVFLAIDNVWEAAYESACKIMTLHFTRGSKILVTSRSLGLLKEILRCHDGVMKWIVMPIPSITEEEALEALRFYGGHSVSHVPSQELSKVVRSCFFEGQCHPLLLKAMGYKLRPVLAGRIDNIARLLSSATNKDRIDEELEKTVLSILRTSYNEITPRLKKIFLDLQILDLHCHTCFFPPTLEWQCEWLSMVYEGLTGEGIRYELMRLEYYGLLELVDHHIIIHDLYRDVARAAILDSGKYLVVNSGKYLATETIDWSNLERIWIEGHSCSPSVFTTILHNLKKCFRTKLLHVRSEPPSLQGMEPLCVSNLTNLTHLHLQRCSSLQAISGLEGLTNLTELNLERCSSLQAISGLEGLTNLAKLNLKGCSGNLRSRRLAKLNLERQRQSQVSRRQILIMTELNLDRA